MIHIRPRQLLRVPDSFPEKIAFFMPQAEATGSMTVLESIMLVKLMRCVDPERLFEFGTFKGLTTRLLLENLRQRDGADAPRIVTLDLPEVGNTSFQGTDRELATLAVTYRRKYLESAQSHLVRQVLQDSMTFDPTPYRGKFQYILVDGNHEVSHAMRDTDNAFAMLGGPPACIVWHDYGNREFPQLTAYLEELSARCELHHIEETMLVFHLTGLHVAPAGTSRVLDEPAGQPAAVDG